MKIERLVSASAAAALALGLAASAHADIITVTYTGIVTSGLDQSGVFGAAGTNLAGDTYTAVYTVDDSVLAYQDYEPPGLSHIFGGTEYAGAHDGQLAPGVQSPVSATFTINGVTVSLPGAYYGDAWQTKPGPVGGEEYFVAQDQSVNGSINSNDYLEDKLASTLNAIAPSYDFHVPFSYTLQPNDEYHSGSFLDSVCNSGSGLCSVYASANLSPETITIVDGGSSTPPPPPPPPPPSVPEPATWAMMILGVGMIGFAARRRSEGAALAV